jgi:hypothetical protein
MRGGICFTQIDPDAHIWISSTMEKMTCPMGYEKTARSIRVLYSLAFPVVNVNLHSYQDFFYISCQGFLYISLERVESILYLVLYYIRG